MNRQQAAALTNIFGQRAQAEVSNLAEAVGQCVTKANEGTLYDNSSFFVGGTP